MTEPTNPHGPHCEQNLVTVYDPEGNPHEMSKLNGTDLVAHSKYTRDPKPTPAAT